MLRYPSLRLPLDILFLIACAGLTAYILAPELFLDGKTKDYPLWFSTAQLVLNGADIYPKGLNDVFAFLYPPLPAVLLTIPSYLGKVPLYFFLIALNAASWWLTLQLSNAMAGSTTIPGSLVAGLPSFIMLPYVVNCFDLGQPNLFLLAMVLLGFWWLEKGYLTASGAMFGLATAIKVFPVAILPYLIWRRRWASAASMAAFIGIFLVLVPAPVRGFDRNISELMTWYRGMVGSGSELGFGQRDEQNWSWVNQSIIAVTHRLTRPVNYNQINPDKPARYMNLLDLDFKIANWTIVALSLLIGLGFLAVMPPSSKVSRFSNAEELGILFSLIAVASPLARSYYFVWLYFPVTVLVQRAAFDPRPEVRKATWLVLGIACFLLALALPGFPVFLQAIGNNLAATAVIIAGLAWHLRHPPGEPVGLPVSAPAKD